MKRYLVALVFAVLLASPVFAQKVLLSQDVRQDTVKKNFGPNKKYFGHFYGGYGLMAGPAEGKGSEIEYPASHEFMVGYRFKFKVAKFYALGFETAIQSQTFVIKQQDGKTLPSPILYDEEKLRFTEVGLGVYNRFNYGRRGNHIGNFVDLGVYGNWLPFKAHLYEDDDMVGLGGNLNAVDQVKVKKTGLRYVTDFNYGTLARVGFNRYVLYGSYRLSDLFNTGYYVTGADGKNIFDFAELPRLTIGFQIGIH